MKEKMMFEAKRHKSIVVTSAVALALMAQFSGCHVGPQYHPPAPTAVTAPNYKESTVNFQDADGWKVASPQDAMVRGKWWEVLMSRS
jgi:predicted small lipoprotein YifL